MKSLSLFVFILFPLTAFSNELTVQVSQGQMREQPSFFAKIIQPIAYQNVVRGITLQNAWYLVSFRGKKGWMHRSALKTLEFKLIPGESVKQEVSSEDIALAGKGFNADIENKYKKQHQNLNFYWVDYMEEKLKVNSDELQRFVNEIPLDSNSK